MHGTEAHSRAAGQEAREDGQHANKKKGCACTRARFKSAPGSFLLQERLKVEEEEEEIQS